VAFERIDAGLCRQHFRKDQKTRGAVLHNYYPEVN